MEIMNAGPLFYSPSLHRKLYPGNSTPPFLATTCHLRHRATSPINASLRSRLPPVHTCRSLPPLSPGTTIGIGILGFGFSLRSFLPRAILSWCLDRFSNPLSDQEPEFVLQQPIMLNQNKTGGGDEYNHNNQVHHPYAFHVSGPRKVSAPNWRDLINSSWKDGNYKRTVIACFIQSVYLLELDRQENRSPNDALAPKWFIPFKYKLSKTLIDERDGSIYGAILEWDRSAAMSDFILIRPSCAPRAVLALRGTLLKGATYRRDIEDDLRFLTWESLKGSVRFDGALNALKAISDAYGSNNIAVAGHSLGAGFALQIGKSLAKQGLFVETHLFNPPSVSLAMSLKNMGERAVVAWQKVRSMVSSSVSVADENSGYHNAVAFNKWVPHLYVNNSDYICCYYTDQADGEEGGVEKENMRPSLAANGHVTAKLFVLSKGKQKFMEAHGLEQWWSDDLELELALQSSKLSKQLKSLYSLPPRSATNLPGTIANRQ